MSNATSSIETQVIDAEKLTRVAVVLAWVFGVIAPLVISTLGNYIAFSGTSWQNFSILSMRPDMLVYAVLWQACCTTAQFAFRTMGLKTGSAGWWMAYIFALLVSAVPSVIGYFGLASGRIIAILVERVALEAATAIAGFIIGVVCVIFDMLPDLVLVKR